MKTIIKKISSIVLLVAMLATLFAAPVYAAEETTASSDSQYAVGLLNALGITDLAYNVDLNAKVSRAEFAVLLTQFANTPASSGSTGFVDVLSGSYEESYIKTVVSLGYMLPVNDEYFYPAWEITAQDAAHAFLMTLGYGDVATTPQAVSNFAARLDLYSDVNANNFTRGELYKMMYNALMANVMDQAGVKDGKLIYEQLKDVNALYYFHEVIKSEGTITGAGGVSLGSGSRSTLEKGQIELDGYRFVCEGHDMNAILGRNAYVFWRDINGSNIDNAIYVEVVEENTLKLKASDIINYASMTYEYEVDGKSKTYSLNKPYVIYNGEEYTKSYTKNVMMPDSGDVTIVKDGSRDVVIIRSFVDDLVNFVINNEDTTAILGKNAVKYGFDLDKGYVEIYDVDGFALDLSKVKENSVISVAESDSGEKITIYVSEQSVAGGITLADDNEWTIGDTVYTISPALKARLEVNPEEMPEFNKQYTFYINCNGEIAFVEDGASALEDGVFYAIVTACSTGNGGFTTDVALKVYSKTMGGFETYAVADKVELNGVRSDEEDVVAALKKNGRDGIATNEFVAQPVKIGLNAENEVNYLMQAASNNNDGKGFFYFMGSTNPDTKGTYYQYRNVFSYSKQEGGRDFAASPKDDGHKQVGLGNSTEIIQVPFYKPAQGQYMGKIDIDSEKAFISTSRPTGVPFLVYKEDEDDLVASFIIRAVEAGEKEHCESTVNVHCILSITDKVVDGDVVTCIKTNKMTYYLDNPNINLNALKIWDTLESPEKVEAWIDPATGVQGVHKVVPGDLVNIVADATGFIKAMEIVYDSVGKRMMGKGTGTGSNYGYINSETMWFSRNTQFNLTLLHVLKIEDGYISATDAKDPAEFIADPSTARHYLGVTPPIICVEEGKNGKLTSRNAVNSDLIGYYDSPEDHATVILSHRYAQQQGTSFVIVK